MTKRHLAPIERGRIRLRLLESADLPATLAWRNQDHIRKWFLTTAVITPEQHQNWFARNQQRDDDFVFVIEEREALRRPVGQVAIYNIDWAAGRAEFGRLMLGDPAAAGQGIAKDATQLIVDEALASWGLREIYLQVIETNVRAIAIYRACGFSETSRSDGLIHMSKRAG